MAISFNSNMGNFQQPMDPDAYAQQYANQKGISLDEAKAELKKTMGEPEKPQENGNNSLGQGGQGIGNVGYNQGGRAPQGNFGFMGQQNYGDMSLFGPMGIGNNNENNFDPFGRNDGNSSSIFNFNDNSENQYGLVPEEQELLEAGIPYEVILGGKDAIKNYADENNITLPNEYQER